jgi:hypothetical protein
MLPIFAVPATAQDKPLTTPYYPLKVGAEWTYRAGKETVVVRVDKEVRLEFNSDGKDDKTKLIGFRLSTSSGSREREVMETIVIVADGVYRFRTAGKLIKPPLRFLKLPVNEKESESWKVDSMSADGTAIRGAFVTGKETIQLVLAGRMLELPTVTVTSKDFQIGNKSMSVKYWFAENLGLVKQRVQIGKDDPVTLELQEFKAGP